MGFQLQYRLKCRQKSSYSRGLDLFSTKAIAYQAFGVMTPHTARIKQKKKYIVSQIIIDCVLIFVESFLRKNYNYTKIPQIIDNDESLIKVSCLFSKGKMLKLQVLHTQSGIKRSLFLVIKDKRFA